ncbi:MAG TPA: hypothetical protein VH475_17625 [Tepidisphaeraceae bacterium]|jgi:hypothetical protein
MVLRSLGLRCIAITVLSTAPARAATVFADSVPAGGYTMGNVYVASGATYDDTAAVLGAPSPIVGAGSAYAGVLSPFNAHYETSDLVAIGRGGALTLHLSSAVPVSTAGPEIGVFTSASFLDQDYPNGAVANPAHTAAFAEYGAERTAVVEVATTPGNFVSLGRITFDKPANYYANASAPYQYPPPASPAVADFGKPFTGDLASLSGRTFPQLLAALDGSAGGTWIDVPTGLGLSQVNYVRFSDPMWLLGDGTLAETRTSIYDPTYVKPADLFIDAVAGANVPEPVGPGLLAIISLLRRRRRGRGG